ncbi:molybdenum cofactor cytidylyltransferase [Roseiarcus fermentans]|uniref:Molybdenum cofactor cytidylyltransferase n=1 Tax=Roseiarcus fermentans TaxID=1473586 RepID=A0A366FBR4_9HYPH|nr:molybdopterin-binding protein [Roseiarcus fermentans]RBP11400.1 molybdenum cofactor cytidylyltransferase [Roseiarcus fermentans]
MKFGSVPIHEADGAILAHSVRIDGLTLKKGDVVTPDRRRRLAEAGVASVMAARLEDGDVGENDAAARLASRLAGAHTRSAAPFTGRVNLFAEAAGLALFDRAAIDRVNAIDEAITVATLPAHRPVEDGDMVATVKIIPFSAPAAMLERALDALGPAPAVSVAPFRPLRVAVVSTLLPGLKDSVVDKTLRALKARLAPTGARVTDHVACRHDAAALLEALGRVEPQADALVVFGASAITDRRDVIPAAIEAFGGRIERFGMPVDPGNLLLLAARGGKPIIGAPGCARSPKENGFDWVLQRILAGVPVADADIRAMGVGGLLMEIASRPQPREPHE